MKGRTGKDKPTRMATRVTRGSGNVFADLGLSNPEERLAKAQLAAQINAIVERRGMTQIEAARLLEIDQPSISKLASGKLSGFSMERLIGWLRMLNQNVEIRITAARGRGMGHLAVYQGVH